jgi:hypothetical protein
MSSARLARANVVLPAPFGPPENNGVRLGHSAWMSGSRSTATRRPSG